MYIKDGIAYAGEPVHPMKIGGIRPLSDHRLWVRFSNGEAKVFDLKPLLLSPAFAPLMDEELFREVYIDYGVATWQDGDIDIDPTFMYENSVSAEAAS